MVARGIYYVEYVKPLPPILEGFEYEDEISQIQILETDEDLFRRIDEAELNSRAHLLQKKNEKLIEEAVEKLMAATEGGDGDTMVVSQSLLDEFDLALEDVEQLTAATLKENEILQACILVMGGEQYKRKLEYLNYRDTTCHLVDFELNEMEMETLLRKLQYYFPVEAGFKMEDLRQRFESAIRRASLEQELRLPGLENKTCTDDNLCMGDYRTVNKERKRRIKQQTVFQSYDFNDKESFLAVLEKAAENCVAYSSYKEPNSEEACFTLNKYCAPETISDENTVKSSKLYLWDDKVVDKKKQKRTDPNSQTKSNKL